MRLNYAIHIEELPMFGKSRAVAIVLLSLVFMGRADAQTSLGRPSERHDGWTTAAMATERVREAPLKDLEAAIARGEFPKTTSVLIVRGGKLVYEGYFNGGGPEVLNNTRSATKLFVALAVGSAIHDGAIASARDLAFPYLADLGPVHNDTADKEAIRISDLLTMSSALDCDDNDDASPGNEDRLHEQSNWTRWAVDLPTMRSYARDAMGLGPWRYCTTNAFLTGQIVQRATHTPIDRYIDQKLLHPLGIARRNWSFSPSGEVMTGGGLELRSRDLAKVAWMLVDHGRWHGQTILTKAWVDETLTARRDAGPNQRYGYFVFEGDYHTACGLKPTWYMAGNGGSQILMLKDLNAAVVVTRTNYNVRGSSAQTVELVEKYVLPALPCA
jgi:CubicO group peptidase (beta-lactamase class C family)